MPILCVIDSNSTLGINSLYKNPSKVNQFACSVHLTLPAPELLKKFWKGVRTKCSQRIKQKLSDFCWYTLRFNVDICVFKNLIQTPSIFHYVIFRT